jgi:ferredoxin
MKVSLGIQTLNGQHHQIELEIVAEKGEDSLLELVEEKSQILPFGCRVGSCGTCMIEILAGAENLQARTPQEEDTLSRMAKSPQCRLACRARFHENASGLIQFKTIF